MSGGKNIKPSPGPKSDSTERDMENEGMQSDSGPSLSASGDVNNQPSSSQQSVVYQPVTSYGYIPQADNEGYSNTAGGSYTGGRQSDNSSPQFYYNAGYGYVSVDGKQMYNSSEYLQQPYGSEAFPYYSYDSTYAGNASTGTRNGSGKSNESNAAKTNNNPSSKNSASPLNSNAQHSASNVSRFTYHNQQPKPPNKLSSSYQRPAENYYRNPGVYMQYGPVNYQPSGGRVLNSNYRNRSRENLGRNVENEASKELTRGPRADNKNDSSRVLPEVKQPVVTIEKENYNLEEFQTEYDNAKFYVIKSYSEDDIHKSIKYNVWSSTTNGNKKLDAAYTEVHGKTRETGTLCPVFLFFSVNGSGQFVGVAEMIGHVDFSKNMNFWQVDKWNGFFPIKWHIIKDVPNTQLRHIILENNEDKPVTFSRDTQEIGLKQGVEMLSIFKSYSEKTSLLEDFNFYENREKSLRANRALKSASITNQSDASSLVSLTDNLSLDS